MKSRFIARYGRLSTNGCFQHSRAPLAVKITFLAPQNYRQFHQSPRAHRSPKTEHSRLSEDQSALQTLLKFSELAAKQSHQVIPKPTERLSTLPDQRTKVKETASSAWKSHAISQGKPEVNYKPSAASQEGDIGRNRSLRTSKPGGKYSFRSQGHSSPNERSPPSSRHSPSNRSRSNEKRRSSAQGVKPKTRETASSAWEKHSSQDTVWHNKGITSEKVLEFRQGDTLQETHDQQPPQSGKRIISFVMGEKRNSNGAGALPPKKRIKMTKRNKGGGQGSIDGIPWPDGSSDEILKIEVQQLIDEAAQNNAGETTESELAALFSEIELQVVKISSTGDGLALSPNQKHVYAIPFSILGDTVLARPYLSVSKDSYTRADFIEVVKPSPLRDDSRVNCQYFSKCGGCQFQMMLPEDQLAHKKRILEDAFANFSGIDSSLLPTIEATLPSPLQYSYRTKLTPHFDGPPGFTRRNKDGRKPKFDDVPPIGFMLKGRRQVIDIEDCPIGSEAVRFGLKKERRRVADTIDQFSKGATILLRETTNRKEKQGLELASFQEPVVREADEYFETKSYVTNNNATVKEYVGDSLLINNANSFFQNNNSILPSFIDYVKERLFSKSPETTKPKYLVDAYCGSGLFTVTLAPLFEKSIGVDIDRDSIDFAKENAAHNDLKTRASFITATASEIFQDIKFPASETVMVIDPPRKGCDLPFLRQLMKFGPQRIIYVSCNVHTQARDIGFMVNGVPKIDAGFGEGNGAYSVESLRGCDFFPQTAHVEGVAVLQRKTVDSKPEEPRQVADETGGATTTTVS